MTGPQITARPGTKRHLKQLRARCVFSAVYASAATHAAKVAADKHAAAQREVEIASANLDAFTTIVLALSPAVGSA